MTISVIIPCYNAGKTLQKCLDSALNQVQKPYEVICVDDASTDDTPTILKSYGTRIKVITHTVNQGLGITRGDGIKAATGDYIYCLDSDDWIDPDAIKCLADASDNGKVDIVTGGAASEPLSGLEAVRYYRSGPSPTFMNNRLIRRSLFDIEPHSELRYFEDFDTLPRLIYRARNTAYVKENHYHYNKENPNSLSNTASKTKHYVYKALVGMRLYNYFLEKDPDYILGLDLPGEILVALTYLYVEAKLDPDEFNRWDWETTETLRLITTRLDQVLQDIERGYQTAPQ